MCSFTLIPSLRCVFPLRIVEQQNKIGARLVMQRCIKQVESYNQIMIIMQFNNKLWLPKTCSLSNRGRWFIEWMWHYAEARSLGRLHCSHFIRSQGFWFWSQWLWDIHQNIRTYSRFLCLLWLHRATPSDAGKMKLGHAAFLGIFPRPGITSLGVSVPGWTKELCLG